jgi:glucosamine 6-phosphate synthetase-like amidotransferase/phosphosugar isomerase protein
LQGSIFTIQIIVLSHRISIERLISELLLGIEHRGFDATGIAAVGAASGALHIEKADTEASNFNWWRSNLPETPRSVLLHTRFATKGSPMKLENNHPIRYNNIVVTHNGHINNDDELFSDECLSRNAEVDSEAIAAVFDKYGIDKAHIPLGKFDGNMAVAVADLRKPNTLVLAKGQSSPLYYYNATEGIMWASTEQTIIEASEKALGLVIENKRYRAIAIWKTSSN